MGPADRHKVLPLCQEGACPQHTCGHTCPLILTLIVFKNKKYASYADALGTLSWPFSWLRWDTNTQNDFCAAVRYVTVGMFPFPRSDHESPWGNGGGTGGILCLMSDRNLSETSSGKRRS